VHRDLTDHTDHTDHTEGTPMTTIAPVPEVPVDDEALTEAVRLADGFLAGTNELDEARRVELVDEIWTADGHFIDPLHEATGHAELNALYAQVHTNFPGYTFARIGDVERLARWMRFRWEFRGDDGSLLAAGTDVGEIVDGKIGRIVSFYDHLETS
jgi:hypothetical protein